LSAIGGSNIGMATNEILHLFWGKDKVLADYVGIRDEAQKELKAASTWGGQRHKCTKAGRQTKQVTEQPILAQIKMARNLVKCNNKETRIRTTAFH